MYMYRNAKLSDCWILIANYMLNKTPRVYKKYKANQKQQLFNIFYVTTYNKKIWYQLRPRCTVAIE